MAVSSRWLNVRAAQNYIFHPQHADKKQGPVSQKILLCKYLS